MKLLCSIIALTITGCATDPSIVKMALDNQAAQKPTIELTCPAGGCSLSYVDPRDRNTVRLPTNGYDVLQTAISVGGSVLQGAIVPAAFAITATKGYEAMKGHGTTTTNTTTNTTTTSDSNNQTTHTLSGTGTVGSGAYTATTTTTTDNHSQTATPTVVTQPAPVIVTQPAPIIVGP